MLYRTGSQIREDFLRFFESKGHRRVHSSSLVPANDPTLLFTNAGMNQFKDVFLGADQRPYTRAVTSQKCVRAGGKHNDLENVGFTRRHHTFFEMLGNFSFGDYFKRDAIAYAWELLTSSADHCFAIDPARLYVTIFAGEGSVPRDTEAEDLWIEAGVPKDRIFEMGMKDNFWQMGETGPCGPCSEIFYDLGVASSDYANPDGTRQDRPFPRDDGRYVEIWNLVFMQFERFVDEYACPTHSQITSKSHGVCAECAKVNKVQVLHEAKVRLELLPKPSIDTGMGLERIACVLQGVLSNYQTDLFLPLIQRAVELTMPDITHEQMKEGLPMALALAELDVAASVRIIAEHSRAATFLIADGVVPANDGRGYVLRKIIRRAIRHGRFLKRENPFLYKMVSSVRDEMGNAYPDLQEASKRISNVIRIEEEQFSRMLSVAVTELGRVLREHHEQTTKMISSYVIEVEEQTKSGIVPDFIAAIKESRANASDKRVPFGEKDAEKVFISRLGPTVGNILFKDIQSRYQARKKFDGRTAFKLYETYGLPVDLMADAVRDYDLEFDHEGFEAARAEEQARARASWRGGSQKSANPLYTELPKTEFEGYSALRLDGARVLALTKDGQGTPTLAPGEEGEVILDATSFYADSGGQQGDIGHLLGPDHHTVVAEVRGATKPVQGVFAHKVLALQPIALGDELDTVVDPANRHATERNHTGTHLLHAALRQVLGTHVKQAGSLNNATRLRFDFSHFAPVADAELQEIEDIVNREVLANAHVETLVDVPIDEAVRDLGAMALFGEKYGDRVRVVCIGTFSTELCGGTHTRATGEIGLLKLTGESSVSSGIRRIEALSGANSLAAFRRDHAVAAIATHLIGGAPQSGIDPAEALTQKLAAQDEELKKLRRELDQARMKSAAASTAEAAPVDVKGIKFLAQRVQGLDKAQMRTLVDTLRSKLGSGVVLLGAVTEEGKVSLIAGVTKDLTARVQAGKLISTLAPLVGGKGGGRPDLAEAGGTTPGTLDATLTKAPEILADLLG